jgi:Family of unknown function (DUF6941)
MSLPRLRSIILCDDIRTEITGKELFIGVYANGITFFGPPPGMLMQLCFRIEYEKASEDKLRTLRLQLISPYATPLIDTTGEVQEKTGSRLIVNIQQRNLVITEAGTYTIMIGLDGEPQQADTVDITFRATPPKIDPTIA